MNTVFVYGLLKPGLSLHHRVAPYVERVCAATASGRLYAADYPAARFDEQGEIEGFVYWLDVARLGEALRLLDDIEDEGEMYERRSITVTTDKGPVDAFAYHYLLSVDGRPDVGRRWPE